MHSPLNALVFAACLIAVSSLGAAKAQDIEDCARIDSDLDRLACYDRAAGRTPAVSQTTPAEGDWSVRTETSELTDETNVFMSVHSEEDINCGWNRGGRIQLLVRCMENTTSVIFLTDCHMTSHGGYGVVDYRVDDNPARDIRMEESTSNRALGLWVGRRSIPFIRNLFGARQLIARMTPYAENPFTVTFDIAGLEDAIAPLRAACNW